MTATQAARRRSRLPGARHEIWPDPSAWCPVSSRNAEVVPFLRQWYAAATRLQPGLRCLPFREPSLLGDLVKLLAGLGTNTVRRAPSCWSRTRRELCCPCLSVLNNLNVQASERLVLTLENFITQSGCIALCLQADRDISCWSFGSFFHLSRFMPIKRYQQAEAWLDAVFRNFTSVLWQA